MKLGTVSVYAGIIVAKCVQWEQHTTNEQLYGNLPKATNKIAVAVPSPCWSLCSAANEIASKLVL